MSLFVFHPEQNQTTCSSVRCFFELSRSATMKGLLQVYPERSRRALLYGYNNIEHFVAAANSRPHPGPLRMERATQRTDPCLHSVSLNKQPVGYYKHFCLVIPREL